jgi:hypothetical protein
VGTVKLGIKPGAGRDIVSLGLVWQAKIRAINSEQGYAAFCRKDYGPTQGRSGIFIRMNVVAYALNVYNILEHKYIGHQHYGRVQTVSYWNPPPDLDRYCQIVTFQKRNGQFAAQGDPDLDNIRFPLIAKKPAWLLLSDGDVVYAERI